MLHAATDLIRYKAVIEGDSLTITDLFFSPSLSTLTFLVVRKNSAPWSDQCVVSSRHFGLPNSERREIGLGATEEQVVETPAVEARSPVEVIAQRLVGANDNVDPSEANQIEAIYERASDWIGAPVLQDGAKVVGQVDDFLIEWPQGKVTHAVVNTGTDLPARQVVLPKECYEVPCDRNPSIRLVVDRATLKDAPEIENLDAVDRHWIDTIRTYYKLPI